MSDPVPRHLLPILESMLAPRSPEPTDITGRLVPLSGVGTVAFDVYGTLLTSAAGEINPEPAPPTVDPRVAAHLGVSHDQAERIVARLQPEIERTHRILRSRWGRAKTGAPHDRLQPEVDIREIWRAAFDAVCSSAPPTDEAIEQAALIHELAENPTWLMPRVIDAIDSLVGAGLRCAIVSNAQFYTPVILGYLLGVERLAHFSPCIWSFEQRIAKPSPALFRALFDPAATREALADPPHSVIFVGNDMLNDVWAAARCGLRTMLFAGDRSSLRLRREDERVSRVTPDAVVTSLGEIPPLVGAPDLRRPDPPRPSEGAAS